MKLFVSDVATVETRNSTRLGDHQVVKEMTDYCQRFQFYSSVSFTIFSQMESGTPKNRSIKLRFFRFVFLF